ncbi:hypothetical protein PQX77_009350 [Marasmius sp. AFHP31]|nr:hypothetical protein PQX77_009350 [Marasmius sp. AFHP31]
MAVPRTQSPLIPKAEYRSIGSMSENEVSVINPSNSQEDPESERLLDNNPCLSQFLKNAVRGMDCLEGDIAEQYNPITITRRLPVEVWKVIFDLYMSGLHLSVSKSEWNKVVAMPYTLSHVCSRWRNIVISFPTLWSAIEINLYALDRDIVPILDGYLTYSAYGRGLDAIIRFRASLEQGKNTSTSTNMNDGWTVHASDAFSLLMRRLSNFHTLSLFGFSPRHFLGVDEIEPLTLPRLRSLVLGLALPTEPNCLWSAIQRAPNLTGLTFGTGLRLRSAGTTELLSHSQVRVLDIKNIRSFESQCEDIMTLLPTLRNLDTLKLGGIGDLHDHIVDVPAATSYTLKSLSLTFRDSESVFALLQSLDLPSLESISLSCNTHVNSSSIFISALRRFATLESLSLHFDIDEYGATALNNLIPFLPELFSLDARLREPDHYQQTWILDLFTALIDHAHQLQYLTLTDFDCPLTLQVIEQLVSMLEAKYKTFPPNPNPDPEKPWMAIHLIFGAWCRSTANLFARAKFNERLGILDENGIRCLISYSSLLDPYGCLQDDSPNSDSDASQSPFFAMY